MVMAYLKKSTQSSRKELCLSSLIPPRGQYKTRGGKKTVPGKKNKKLLISFDMGKMLKVDPHWSQALHIFPGNWEGVRTCCRYQHLPIDTEITYRDQKTGPKWRHFLPSPSPASLGLHSGPPNTHPITFLRDLLFYLKNPCMEMRKPGLELTLKRGPSYNKF